MFSISQGFYSRLQIWYECETHIGRISKKTYIANTCVSKNVYEEDSTYVELITCCDGIIVMFIQDFPLIAFREHYIIIHNPFSFCSIPKYFHKQKQNFVSHNMNSCITIRYLN